MLAAVSRPTLSGGCSDAGQRGAAQQPGTGPAGQHQRQSCVEASSDGSRMHGLCSNPAQAPAGDDWHGQCSLVAAASPVGPPQPNQCANALLLLGGGLQCCFELGHPGVVSPARRYTRCAPQKCCGWKLLNNLLVCVQDQRALSWMAEKCRHHTRSPWRLDLVPHLHAIYSMELYSYIALSPHADTCQPNE